MATTIQTSQAQTVNAGSSQHGRGRRIYPHGWTPDRVLSVIGAGLVDAARAQRDAGVANPLIHILQGAGFFLQAHPIKNLFSEAERLMRRRPIPFMLIAAALGFCLARGTRR